MVLSKRPLLLAKAAETEPEPLGATLANAPVFSRVSYAPMDGVGSLDAALSKTVVRAEVPPMPPTALLPERERLLLKAPGRAPE